MYTEGRARWKVFGVIKNNLSYESKLWKTNATAQAVITEAKQIDVHYEVKQIIQTGGIYIQANAGRKPVLFLIDKQGNSYNIWSLITTLASEMENVLLYVSSQSVFARVLKSLWQTSISILIKQI